MLSTVHKIFAFLAFFTILTFWSSTLFVELFASYEKVAFVKSLIVTPGLWILIPSLALTALTGNLIAKRSVHQELIATKKRRMPKIAVLGILVLIPSALYLDHLAAQNIFDTTFYTVQALELFAGATNIYLLAKNIYDSQKALSLLVV